MEGDFPNLCLAEFQFPKWHGQVTWLTFDLGQVTWLACYLPVLLASPFSSSTGIFEFCFLTVKKAFTSNQ